MLEIDALRVGVALGPLAVYFLLLAFVNLSRRPFLTTGARDVAALGTAIAGLIAIGPMELFLPAAASARFGGVAWVLLLIFYALCLTLTVLLMRPRLVIYNTNPEQLRSVLAEVVSRLDREARWAGDNLVLPELGVQLHVEVFGAMRNVQLVSTGPKQNFAGWKQLETALAEVLRETKTSPNPYGFGLLTLGLLLVLIVAYCLISNPTVVVQGVDHILKP